MAKAATRSPAMPPPTADPSEPRRPRMLVLDMVPTALIVPPSDALTLLGAYPAQPRTIPTPVA